MTREETKKIIMVIMSVYPNWKPNDLSFTVDAWYLMLQDESYGEMSAALASYIKGSDSAFAPSIGQLMQQLTYLKQQASGQKELTEVEAWNMVYKAICNSNYNSDSEFDKLPDDVKRAVGSPAQLREWAQTDVDQLNVTDKNAFFRSYRVAKENAKREVKLEKDLARLAENTVLQLGGR